MLRPQPGVSLPQQQRGGCPQLHELSLLSGRLPVILCGMSTLPDDVEVSRSFGEFSGPERGDGSKGDLMVMVAPDPVAGCANHGRRCLESTLVEQSEPG